MRVRFLIYLVSVFAVVVAACDNGAAELTTTSVLVTGTTEDPGVATTTTTVSDEEEATPTTLRGEVVETYEVIIREPADEGEILHILIPPGAYTEVDIENFLGDLIEANPDLWGAEVFDSEEALLAYQIPEGERTEEEQELIDEHHFASMLERLWIRYRGPFSELGQFIIGS